VRDKSTGLHNLGGTYEAIHLVRNSMNSATAFMECKNRLSHNTHAYTCTTQDYTHRTTPKRTCTCTHNRRTYLHGLTKQTHTLNTPHCHTIRNNSDDTQSWIRGATTSTQYQRKTQKPTGCNDVETGKGSSCNTLEVRHISSS